MIFKLKKVGEGATGILLHGMCGHFAQITSMQFSFINLSLSQDGGGNYFYP